MMAYNFWAPFAGLTYADSYMSVIFDKLVHPGFGFEITFYSGFCCIGGALFALFAVERFNRVTLLCSSQLGIVICMWLLSFAFYFDLVYFAVAVNLVFIFILYCGQNGITFVFVNELSEPFVVGVGFALSWSLRSLLGIILPILYQNLP